MSTAARTGYAAVLGRWQPVHLGHAAVVQSLCEQYGRVVIGIGSANVQDYRSPFSLKQVEQMLSLVLTGFDNYELAPIPDLPDDETWCQTAQEAFGRPDVLFTANPYVRALLAGRYTIRHPARMLPPERKIAVSGTEVRRRLAQGTDWEALLPEQVATFLQEQGLDSSFRQSYGLHTLVMETIIIK